ncbi:MAG: hypothetical protein EXR70_24410 [Deltaproteobacteria bacterium]|nr:hypothetical protein [Deltaproteobacteria bacterium]
MHGPLLALLTFFFALRVFGQALVAFTGVTWLPAMEHWFSGVIPYPALLIIQLLMLLLMLKVVGEIWRGRGFYAEVRPHWSQFLERFSAVYAASMVLRYILTMSLQPEMRWFGGVIPITFHFVLAAFVYVLGRYHRTAD